MNKQGSFQLLLNPKTITYVMGGALIGYFVFGSTNATFIGGIVGLILSFIK